jgi:murein DD-endopeptidase MepM/ murein hydrolase activator NlpD
VEGLLAQSAALAARIQAAQAAAAYATPTRTAAGASSSGFVWPVHGVLTSSFGWRWGRMHEGIDIAVGNGTPVVASASGTVIVAGWMGGYGNLVVVDHGNGIATAYGHNTSIAVGVGQPVAQGQLIAYSGNTGHSTGPHVHFEVRVNGAAVDPLGYL